MQMQMFLQIATGQLPLLQGLWNATMHSWQRPASETKIPIACGAAWLEQTPGLTYGLDANSGRMKSDPTAPVSTGARKRLAIDASTTAVPTTLGQALTATPTDCSHQALRPDGGQGASGRQRGRREHGAHGTGGASATQRRLPNTVPVALLTCRLVRACPVLHGILTNARGDSGQGGTRLRARALPALLQTFTGTGAGHGQGTRHDDAV